MGSIQTYFNKNNYTSIEKLKSFGQNVSFWDNHPGLKIKANTLELLDIITDPKAALKFWKDGVKPEKPYRVHLSDLISQEEADQIQKNLREKHADDHFYIRHNKTGFDCLAEVRKIHKNSLNTGNYLPKVDEDNTTLCTCHVYCYGDQWAVPNEPLSYLMTFLEKISLPAGNYAIISSITGYDNQINSYGVRKLTVDKNGKPILYSSF